MLFDILMLIVIAMTPFFCVYSFKLGFSYAMHFSDIAKKARQIVEEQAEQRLYIKGRVADIFTMKSQYKWQEEQTTRHVVQIASPEDAKQALEALKLLDE